MPLDVAPTQITHNPNQRIDYAPGRLGLPGEQDPNDGLADLIDLLKGFTGIDLANPQTWPIIGSLIEVLTGIEDGDLNDLGTWANNIIAAIASAAAAFGQAFIRLPIIQDIIEVISGVEDGDVDDLGTWVNNIVYDIRETIDSIVRGLLGWAGNGFGHETSEEALLSAAATISALNASITELQNDRNNQAVGGVTAFVDFTQLPAGPALPSDFQFGYSLAGSGQLVILPNHLGAAWEAVNDGERQCDFLYATKQTVTSYQKTGIAFATAPEWFSGTRKGVNRIKNRQNITRTSCVYVQLDRYRMELGCVVAGATTVFTVENDFIFKPNTVYWLESGTIAGVRIHNVYEGSTLILHYEEPGTTSMEGAAYRYTGGSAYAYANNSTTYGKPARMLAFAMGDNQPTTLKGSTFKRYRQSTANVTPSGNGTYLFPAGFFDSTDRVSNDLVSDPAANKVTVSVEGTYLVIVRVALSSWVSSAMQWAAAVFKNGAVYEVGLFNILGESGPAFGWIFEVYLEPGDYVQPGYRTETSVDVTRMTGEISGSLTSWSVALMNASLT